LNVRGFIGNAFLCLFLLYGCAPVMIPAEATTVQKTIDIPRINKDIIYERSRIWIAKTFRSSKAVIEYENKETGVIIGNGVVSYPLPAGPFGLTATVPVRFTMTEEIKDEKIRITFDNLFEGTGDFPATYKQSMDQIRPRLLSLADDLGAALRSPKAGEAW
jgi:Domain of unknown function (DUF4468) with TBP-like fold